MKTINILFFGLVLLCPMLIEAQNQKGNFLIHGQATHNLSNTFQSQASGEYFISDRFSISLAQQSDQLFENFFRHSLDEYDLRGRYYLSKSPGKNNWFFQIHSRLGLEVYKSTFRDSDNRSQILSHWSGMGFGLNRSLNPNVYLSGFLGMNVIRLKQDLLHLPTSRKNLLGLAGQIDFNFLLPIKKSELSEYQIVYFHKGQKYLGLQGRVIALGYASRIPFEMDLNFTRGTFLNNHWLWGIHYRLGYFEFQGFNEAIHVQIAPFIRYYYPMLSKRWRLFTHGQIRVLNHFEESNPDPLFLPRLDAGVNYFLSPEVALEVSFGYELIFDTFGLQESVWRSNIGFRYFL